MYFFNHIVLKAKKCFVEYACNSANWFNNTGKKWTKFIVLIIFHMGLLLEILVPSTCDIYLVLSFLMPWITHVMDFWKNVLVFLSLMHVRGNEVQGARKFTAAFGGTKSRELIWTVRLTKADEAKILPKQEVPGTRAVWNRGRDKVDFKLVFSDWKWVSVISGRGWCSVPERGSFAFSPKGTEKTLVICLFSSAPGSFSPPRKRASTQSKSWRKIFSGGFPRRALFQIPQLPILNSNSRGTDHYSPFETFLHCSRRFQRRVVLPRESGFGFFLFFWLMNASWEAIVT